MPANSGYFVAAYAVTAVVYLLYGLSIIVRVRALRDRVPGDVPR